MEVRVPMLDEDLFAFALTLPHRLKRGPFYQAEMSMEDLQERIEQLQGASANTGEPEMQPSDEQASEKKKP